MKKVFTIIKESSERVKSKNFRILGNKPLWSWVLDELKDFDVYVNTDSEKLFEELKYRSNITPIRRNQKHIDWEMDAATLGSPVMDMTKEYCEHYLGENEDFALVHVTSPFMKAQTLSEAFDEFDRVKNHSLHSVKHIQDALMYLRNGQLIPSNFTLEKVCRTQDLKPVYQSLGAFFIMNSCNLKRQQYQRVTSSTKLKVLSPLESIEIDTEDDLELAKLIAFGMQEERNEFY